MGLTGDGHVHSEWSWDTGGPQSSAAGTMEATCRRAVQIGLPALAFTEHLERTGWAIGPEDLLDQLRPLVDLASLDRVNGSLHTIPVTDEPDSVRSEPITLYRFWPAEKVIREYLIEIPRMLAGSSVYGVFCHLEYAVRYWPVQQEGPFDPKRFEGGRAITIGSDAHTADSVASNFYEAMAMAEHFGFRPGRRPQDPWIR